MKDSDFEHVYDSDWDRHPKCSHSRAFVISRFIDSEGRLVTKRLHAVYQEVPYFIRCIIGNVVSYAGEESIVDPKTKSLTLRTKNLSMSCVALCDELCVYTPLAGDSRKTMYRKSIHVQGWLYGLANSKVEDWCVDVDKKNRGNGINVMDEIIQGFTQFVLPTNNHV
ncbi:hypothetical protein JH06_4880 [Blastocystis sp. subtype 4]|uniref:hypothetical protein n=1 Tax=Blastocystis sp. subtype 4 TaxID=944170 RepID=UPI000711C5B9|nr:hypothetical protein JH06_4880 [Blastocystis sp. subtype 4]KNB41641.1 hypothetical protein JH06_4880 [Blastocystis sp. subtype 4]|eukprot:XP_014525084.1 hypothetical protein JH06_4880 [Blastocystis sp. subtype 4]